MTKAKVKCAECGVESGNITMHMRTHETGTGTANIGSSNTPSEFVTKTDFDEKFGQLLNLVEKMVEPKTGEAQSGVVAQPQTEAVRAAAPDKTPVPAEWNFYIDEKLGKDVGRSVFYPKSGNGFTLQMSIPRDLSNAPDDHWNYYKHDLRSKAIDPREGFEGVKVYIDLVARNLKLDPRTVAERNQRIPLN